MGNRKMICVSLSSDVDLSSAAKVIALAVNQARVAKQDHINIVFLAQAVSEVFRYKDEFTKYIDIGVRVYMEKSIEVLKNIILKECKILYTSANDEKIRNLLYGMPRNLAVQEI